MCKALSRTLGWHTHVACFVQHANLKLVISLSESDSMVTQLDI